ncbi:MAG: hypothetical protein JSU86_12930 [Phycisphaerales bacterium]|nr:MAG: hypothetical protein JSU86_12930 [Phycisphaerales bacterium]
MPSPVADSSGRFPLDDEHRMLLRIRDTLYEGCWEDFVRDLRARAQGRPHVFETVTDSPAMKTTIENHLAMIDEMQTWELQHERTLSADDPATIT